MLSTVLLYILIVLLIILIAVAIAIGGFFVFAWVLVDDALKHIKKHGL